jgi:hypothetical protein
MLARAGGRWIGLNGQLVFFRIHSADTMLWKIVDVNAAVKQPEAIKKAAELPQPPWDAEVGRGAVRPYRD